jgi:hypothetical protein
MTARMELRDIGGFGFGGGCCHAAALIPSTNSMRDRIQRMTGTAIEFPSAL